MDTNFEQENLYVKYEPLSPWAYLGYILLFSIPGINIIAIIVLAFAGENINRKNLARAYLINICIGFILSIILSVIIIGIGGLLFNSAKNVTNSSISQIENGIEIFNAANQLTEEAVSKIDTIAAQTFNSRFISYEGDSVKGAAVKTLQKLIETTNNSDSSLSKISIICETDITPSKTYDVSFDYDSKTGYINKVTIIENE